MLSRPWTERRPHYDFVIVGSGYGGAITAARLATADLTPRPSICVLERGREWPVGSFPDSPDRVLRERRGPLNPLGLYEFLTYPDISVIKGNGLGGTSLVNANVAIVPDAEVFRLAGWPASLTLDVLAPYYERARQVLAPGPHPRAAQLPKVQALDRRAQEMGTSVLPLNIAVNFTIDGVNPHGVEQKPCIDCGDCVTGCNVGAKNTLAMNYLPMAAAAGAEMYTQVEVEWIAAIPGGGWRVHGRRVDNGLSGEAFQLTAANVILAAGSINSTEILLRSELHGLPLSPRVGSGFSGNADFFGLAYNGNHRTQVCGFGNNPGSPGAAYPPGPTIVAAVRYPGPAIEQRMLIEDLSFPLAYVDAARLVFALLRGEDTDLGDEAEERRRVQRDLVPFTPVQPDGALNHTMLYLCMGFDDAKGAILLKTSPFDPDGRVEVHWQDVGSQVTFARLNEEVRRHARTQGASFIPSPLWALFDTRPLITAHPLGGCPIGEDYQQGAVDEFGRVFAGDGAVHEGLFVADGSLVPSALGVNPFLTISALSERIVERKIRQLQGEAYPAPPPSVGFSAVDPIEVSRYTEGELERLYRRAPSREIGVLVNRGGHSIDTAARRVRNDRWWKGYFPKGHVLNAMSAALFTGFRKRFTETDGRLEGVTSDTDGRINARNTLEEITIATRQGDLEPGRYILLRYVDPPWQGYYDVFKAINDDLLIGRVYLGSFPHGTRLFTFPMTRVYEFRDLTVADHRELYAAAAVPGAADLEGVWRMDVVSNANHLGGIAYLHFERHPDGRLECRYQALGLMEGLVAPAFLQSHFQLTDFTPFHDEIRKVGPDLLVGKYVTDLPPELSAALPAASLGLLHTEDEGGQTRVGVYYMLSRTDRRELPTATVLRPFLDVHLPPGVGLTFDEEMVGWYFPGVHADGEGRDADLTIGLRIPPSGDPPGGVAAGFRLRMAVRDLNEFIEGSAHEAKPSGTVRFDRFEGSAPAVFAVDEWRSTFNYLRVNEATGEAQMCYHLVFRAQDGRTFVLDGRKYMEKTAPPGPGVVRDVLQDYTTLYCHVYEEADGHLRETGVAYLKFRTFEDLYAVANLTQFLRSFTVTGVTEPLLELQARMRFVAFTAQFVLREYDPLAPPVRPVPA